MTATRGIAAGVGGTPNHLLYQCVLQASFNLVEGPLAVAGLGAVPVDHEPDNRPQPLNQWDPNLILDAPGRREVQLGLHSSVGAVGMLTTGTPRWSEAPTHLAGRHPTSRAGRQHPIVSGHDPTLRLAPGLGGDPADQPPPGADWPSC